MSVTARRVRLAAALVPTLVCVAMPAVAPAASAASRIELRELFPRELAKIDRRTSVPLVLPRSLPWTDRLPTLYLEGATSAGYWRFTVSAAPRCGGATACFVGSFSARRAAALPRGSSFRLSGGQRAVYTPIRCGASCGPASISFRHRGALFTWTLKEPPRGGRRTLAALASAAIAELG